MWFRVLNTSGHKDQALDRFFRGDRHLVKAADFFGFHQYVIALGILGL